MLDYDGWVLGGDSVFVECEADLGAVGVFHDLIAVFGAGG